MSREVIDLLAGTDQDFSSGLRDLGWFKYPPTLAPHVYRGQTRLQPSSLMRAEIPDAGAWVYLLKIDSGRWRDARAVIESQHRAEPHFSVFFVNLGRTLAVFAPEDVSNAGNGRSRFAHVEINVDSPSNFDLQTLARLRSALRDRFRRRIQDVVSADKVTKSFYEEFRKVKDAFVDQIGGIAEKADRHWYASVLLNRLMFIYFVQDDHLLNDDPRYLRTNLTAAKSRGDNYYRDFLCPLFFQGLSAPAEDRDAAVAALVRNIPYLNGGLFLKHRLEEYNTRIEIENSAFEAIFKLFDAYTWHIDDRPLVNERQINPDVLGYIFEKYVNERAEQKKSGAYYTKEDITGYICRNTILPRLFDMLAELRGLGENATIPFEIADIEPYVYAAVKKGTNLPLPPEIACGLDDVSRRERWNEPAPAEFANPTEIWREVVARRKRFESILEDFRAGKIRTPDDFITYNLDIEKLARDFVASITDAGLLRDFYFGCLKRITVLDPTCGSGAFLFAALRILAPLYEGCLLKMEQLAAADGAPAGGEALTMAGEFAFANEVDPQQAFLDPDSVDDKVLQQFKAELSELAKHSRQYHVHKSVVVNNLFGVDMMEEAVEISKLRLFLHLIGRAEPVKGKDNLGLEPLPDIDFNILAGNTLVGYVNRKDREDLCIAAGFDWDYDPELDTRVRAYSDMLDQYRRVQLGELMPRAATKSQIETAGAIVRDGEHPEATKNPCLNNDLHRVFSKVLAKGCTRKHFVRSHKPLHWFVEFPTAMAKGGFDVIVGNPPWREVAAVRGEYEVIGNAGMACGNLYAACIERSLQLRHPTGALGFIVQLPLVCSPRMASARRSLRQKSRLLSVATFDDRPGKLFEGLQHCRSTIFISHGGGAPQAEQSVTEYHRWPTAARPHLFSRLQPAICPPAADPAERLPKLKSPTDAAILSRLRGSGFQPAGLRLAKRETAHFVFYQESAQYWVKTCVGLPFYSLNGREAAPPHGRFLYAASESDALVFAALMNCSLFYLTFVALGDCFHVNQAMVESFPVPAAAWGDPEVVKRSRCLMSDLHGNASRKTIRTSAGDLIAYEEFVAGRSKPIIDEIDRVLAKHYGFTDEELDFIINYDFKYRMGRDSEAEASAEEEGDGE